MSVQLLRVGAFVASFIFAVATNSVINRIYPMSENVAMGSMGIAPNGRGYFSSFRSRDEVNLVFERFDFPSHEEAKVAFQNTLHEAERIVEREVLYDREGKLITGERVVITYRTESEVAAVVSLDDTKLYRIVSASLRHALF